MSQARIPVPTEGTPRYCCIALSTAPDDKLWQLIPEEESICFDKPWELTLSHCIKNFLSGELPKPNEVLYTENWYASHVHETLWTKQYARLL